MAAARARLLLFRAGLLAAAAAAAADLGSGDGWDADAPPGNRDRPELPADTADHRMRRATTGLPVRLRPPSLSFPAGARPSLRSRTHQGRRALAPGTCLTSGVLSNVGCSRETGVSTPPLCTAGYYKGRP